jgi:hypothetical protein
MSILILVFILGRPGTAHPSFVFRAHVSGFANARIYLLASGLNETQLSSVSFTDTDKGMGFDYGGVFRLEKVLVLQKHQRLLMTRFDIEAEGDGSGTGGYHGWEELEDNFKLVSNIIFVDSTPEMSLKMCLRFPNSEFFYSAELVRPYPPDYTPSTGFTGLMYANKYLPHMQPCLVGFSGVGWDDVHDFGFEHRNFRRHAICNF